MPSVPAFSGWTDLHCPNRAPEPVRSHRVQHVVWGVGQMVVWK